MTRRYDQLVQSRTVRRPGLDAAVLRLRPDWRGLALTLDGQGRLGSLDPRLGGQLAVLEAARNVACVGGEPLGFTDCLNFGNPEKPEIGWELAETIEGMALACEALGVPIVSGNVSLYNDTHGRSIDPTPVVGCVGLVPDVRRVPRGWRRVTRSCSRRARRADARGLRGPGALGLGRRARRARPRLRGGARAFSWRARRHASLVHDVAEGGLAVALAEAALWSGVGAELDLDDDPRRSSARSAARSSSPFRPTRWSVDPTGGRVDVPADRDGRRRRAARPRRSTSSGAPEGGRG